MQSFELFIQLFCRDQGIRALTIHAKVGHDNKAVVRSADDGRVGRVIGLVALTDAQRTDGGKKHRQKHQPFQYGSHDLDLVFSCFYFIHLRAFPVCSLRVFLRWAQRAFHRRLRPPWLSFPRFFLWHPAQLYPPEHFCAADAFLFPSRRLGSCAFPM